MHERTQTGREERRSAALLLVHSTFWWIDVFVDKHFGVAACTFVLRPTANDNCSALTQSRTVRSVRA